MKNAFAVAVLAICVAVPSFAADVVGHSIKVTGKERFLRRKLAKQEKRS